jgi:hypothetical protein
MTDEVLEDIPTQTPEQYMLAIDELRHEIVLQMRRQPEIADLEWTQLRSQRWFKWPGVTFAQGETAMREAKRIFLQGAKP